MTSGIPATGDGKGIAVIVICAVFLFFSFVAVSLRATARYLKGVGLYLTDYVMIIALVGSRVTKTAVCKSNKIPGFRLCSCLCPCLG